MLPDELIAVIYSFFDNYFELIIASNTCQKMREILHYYPPHIMVYFLKHISVIPFNIPERSQKLAFFLSLTTGENITITPNIIEYFGEFYSNFPEEIFTNKSQKEINEKLYEISRVDYNISDVIYDLIAGDIKKAFSNSDGFKNEGDLYIFFHCVLNKRAQWKYSIGLIPGKEHILCRFVENLIVDNKFMNYLIRNEDFARDCVEKIPQVIAEYKLMVDYPQLTIEKFDRFRKYNILIGVKSLQKLITYPEYATTDYVANMINRANYEAIAQEYCEKYPIIIPNIQGYKFLCKYHDVDFYVHNIQYVHQLFTYEAWDKIRDLIRKRSSHARESLIQLVFKSKKMDLIRLLCQEFDI